jgi:hypothetical protein
VPDAAARSAPRSSRPRWPSSAIAVVARLTRRATTELDQRRRDLPRRVGPERGDELAGEVGVADERRGDERLRERACRDRSR